MLGFMRASALAMGLAVIVAVPAVAMDSMMMAAPSCSADSLHAAMASMSKKMDAVKLSGSPDMDYAQAINNVMEMEHMLNAWEMKCGKNTKLTKMAGDMQKHVSSMMTSITSLTQGG